MNLFCLGLNYRTASIEVRERYAGTADTAAALRSAGCEEFLLLSTCNRVEIYVGAKSAPSVSDLIRSLSADDQPAAPDAFYTHEGVGCARHLFRVVSGLESMVVGETEILGQAKRAYESARAHGQAGPLLHRLCQRAFRVAKQVRTKTHITRGSVSVGSVAVDLAEKIFGDLRGRKVLVLGAGEASEKTLRALAARGVSDLRVSNRSPERAEQLAAALEGIAVPFGQWIDQCREIDILISSTAAETAFLRRDLLEPYLAERSDRPLFIIDIAVPRNVAAEVNAVEGVYLYDIDSLQTIANEAVELRRQQFVLAEEIIDDHVTDFAGKLRAAGSRERSSLNSANLSPAWPAPGS